MKTLRDPAIRYGLKCGIAGVLTVFFALLLRLDNPGWGLFTVFVLMSAQYIGAISEKSLFRLVGTLVGGMIGYLLTGSLQQNPVIFLCLVGLVIGGCTAMFGQSRYPYAFLLCGITTMVVVSNGMADPATSWKFMLSRIEEVFLGIVVSLVVQSVLWPQYAQVEFLAALRTSFGDLRGCFLDAPGVRDGGPESDGGLRAQDFPARITGLRMLLEFGARESLYFRSRLDIYYGMTACAGKIAYAIGSLREKIPADSPYRRHAGAQVAALYKAVAAAIGDLADPGTTKASRADVRRGLDRAFDELESAFLDMRVRDLVKAIPAAQAMILGLHVLGMDEIRTQIVRAHGLLDANDAARRETAPVKCSPPWPPPFWIRAGVKSGLALMAALALDNWLHPPGGPMFVLCVWQFTALNAASPGGRGDRGAFHLIALNIAVLLAVGGLLLVASPMLSSYGVMNAVIFASLFVWGYVSFSVRGMTIPMMLAMLLVVGILSLNGQEPVGFQSIANLVLGLSFGIVVSSVFQRLLWPSLPQWEIRDRFVAMCEICGHLLARTPMPIWIETRLALIPGEIGIRLAHMRPPVCPPGEIERLDGLMRTLTRLGGNLAVTLDKIRIPSGREADGRELIARVEQLLAAGLASLRSGFRESAGARVDEAEIGAAVETLVAWAGRTRLEMIAADSPPLTNARMVGFVKRYALMAEDLTAAGREFSALRLPLYMGDFWL